MCQAHYARWRNGDVQASRPVGPHVRDPRGSLTKKGYRRLYRPSHPNADSAGQVYAHVLAMSDHLGRPLFDGETVHHRNGIRDDNKIRNLELRASMHPRGQSIQDLVAFAHEILDRYSAFVKST